MQKGQPPDAEEIAHPNRLLVKPKKGSPSEQAKTLKALDALHATHKAKVLRKFPEISHLQVLELPKGAKVDEVMDNYRKSGLVEYVEPDYIVHANQLPDDPRFGDQWGLHNTGQASPVAGEPAGVVGADIHAPEAWDISTSASSVIVAVIDTGVRYTHEDLQANIWNNPGETAGDSLDNDGNGWVDDIHGINTVTDTGDPMDDHGHGTHVAGIIAAAGNNSLGVAGVAWQAKIMACKFIGSSGSGPISDAITCIDYARSKGASIINASWGGSPYSQALYDAINRARSDGIIFVAAAGNSADNCDEVFFYPANYLLDNIVPVAASTRTDDLAFFSNFGKHNVAIAAPGYQIWSTYNDSDSGYAMLSGTSMASPCVAGALALLRAQMPTATYKEVIYQLYSGVDSPTGLQDKTLTGGRVNIHKALSTVGVTPPNNAFANANSLPADALSIIRFAPNVGADKEWGEPNHAGNSGGKSVWWSWRAPQSGRVRITTVGSSFDTLLAVYMGSSVTWLAPVASNDDGNYSNDGTTTSYLIFNAVAGTDYKIAVDGKNGASGGIKLDIAYSPVNDDFESSLAIGGDFIGVSADNSAATGQSSEPNHAGVSGGKSLWWSWTAPVSGTFTLSTSGSTFDTIIAVYTGSSLSSLSSIASNNDNTSYYVLGDHGGKTSLVSFNAEAGTVYRIVVDGVNGSSGLINLVGGYNYSVQVFGSYLAGQINNNGLIAASKSVQNANAEFVNHAFLWNGSSWQDIGAGDNSSGASINNSASVVGTRGVAYRWSSSLGVQNLFSGADLNYYSVAYRISDSGAIVGGIGDEAVSNPPYLDYYPKPFYWTEAGGKVEANTIGVAYDINNEGLVVGGTDVAFLWKPGIGGGLVDLGVGPAYAQCVNNGGTIAGAYDYLHWRAFEWNGGKMKDLGTLSFRYAFPEDNNDHGDIVGYGGLLPNSSLPLYKGFIRPQGGHMMDLNTLVDSSYARIFVAASLNDKGQIIGNIVSRGMSLFNPVNKIRLDNPVRLSNGTFQFSIGAANDTYYVETSSDLNNWATTGIITVSGGAGSYQDASASSAAERYYRVRNRTGNALSINAVGFLSRAIPAGLSLIADPLQATDQRIPALFANTPEITEFRKFNPASGTWITYTKTSGTWSDDQQVLLRGEGALVNATAATTLTFVGEVGQGQLRLDVPAGTSAIGAQLSQAGTLESVLGFKPVEEIVQKYDNASGAFVTYTYSNYHWDTVPQISKGEGVLVTTRVPRVCEREYSAWQNSAPTDSDNDQLADTWELDNFGNLAQTAAGDPDGDGWTNGQESYYGTDPNSATSFPFGWTATAFNGSHYQLTAGGFNGLTCNVYASDDNANWTLVGTVTLTGGTGSFTDSSASSYSHRFYQLRNSGNCAAPAGFMKVTAQANSWIATVYQLTAPDPTLLHLFDGTGTMLPNGTQITWNDASMEYTWNNGHWSDNGDTQTLALGDGVGLYNPTANPVDFTFSGKVKQGQVSHDMQILIGSMVPKAGGISSVLQYEPHNYDDLFLWGTTDWESQDYTYYNGQWFPYEPVLQIGQCMMFYPGGGGEIWVQNFNFCQ